jgi:hypothetical protein
MTLSLRALQQILFTATLLFGCSASRARGEFSCDRARYGNCARARGQYLPHRRYVRQYFVSYVLAIRFHPDFIPLRLQRQQIGRASGATVTFSPQGALVNASFYRPAMARRIALLFRRVPLVRAHHHSAQPTVPFWEIRNSNNSRVSLGRLEAKSVVNRLLHHDDLRVSIKFHSPTDVARGRAYRGDGFDKTSTRFQRFAAILIRRAVRSDHPN